MEASSVAVAQFVNITPYPVLRNAQTLKTFLSIQSSIRNIKLFDYMLRQTKIILTLLIKTN